MSSRADHRRRERSWEREDRDRDRHRDRDRNRDRDRGHYSRGGRPTSYRDSGRRRDSRSRSPRRSRSPKRDRTEHDRERDRDREYKSLKKDGKRDYDRADRRYDRRDELDAKKTSRKDDRRDHEVPDRGSMKDADDRTREPLQRAAPHHQDGHSDGGLPSERTQSPMVTTSKADFDSSTVREEGEEMDVTNDDEDMMAVMGLSGFGSTKGKHVEGNQEGTANVKKMRTWRQYMNRRGGFNRPLDKIK